MRKIEKNCRSIFQLKPVEYEKEYLYWPWGILISKTIEYITQHASDSSTIVDYMCGTGYLLNEVSKKRPDLKLIGYNLYPESFIKYATKKYKHISFYNDTVLNVRLKVRPDIVVLTGGLHHLNKKRKASLVKKIASELQYGKLFLVGEEIINNYEKVYERKIAIVDLHSLLMKYILSCESPNFIQKEALKVYYNDFFKITLQELDSLITPYFYLKYRFKTWPEDQSLLGDYLSIYQRK